MEVTLPELLDKKSILLLKLENLGESASNKAKNIKNNLDECNKAIEEFEKKGIEIRKQWSDKLYEYNKEAWVLYDKMAQEEKKEKDEEGVVKTGEVSDELIKSIEVLDKEPQSSPYTLLSSHRLT